MTFATWQESERVEEHHTFRFRFLSLGSGMIVKQFALWRFAHLLDNHLAPNVISDANLHKPTYSL